MNKFYYLTVVFHKVYFQTHLPTEILRYVALEATSLRNTASVSLSPQAKGLSPE